MIVYLLLLIAAICVAFAIGWLLGQKQAPQPAVAATAQITFEITIPADTPPGDLIYLSGSFNSWHPADPAYQLTRTADLASGAWTFSTGQPIQYKLTRGAWDKIEKGAGGLELPNRVITPTTAATVTGKVAEWADHASDDLKVYDARVERVVFTSPALGMERTFFIYLPPEARSDSGARFPSVYLLRGHEREWINKGEDQTREGKRNVIDVYEELRAAGEIGPLVLVFPGMTSANGAVHSLGINMRSPQLAKDPSIGSGRFEDYFFKDLVPYIEARYPVLRGGGHRAVDGFSLGGFMSVNLALRNPAAFGSVGSYDGLFFWDDPAHGKTVALTDTVFARSLFDANFGVPRDRAFAGQHNPLTLLRTNGHAAPGLQWLIEFGPQHAEPGVNYFRGARLLELLEDRGAVNLLEGPLDDGVHTWLMADDHMRRALPLHWQKIKP